MHDCSLQGGYGLDLVEQSTCKAVLNHRYFVAAYLHNLDHPKRTSFSVGSKTEQ